MSRPAINVAEPQRRDIEAVLERYLLLVELYNDPIGDAEYIHGATWTKGFHAGARAAYMQAVKDIREALR